MEPCILYGLGTPVEPEDLDAGDPREHACAVPDPGPQIQDPQRLAPHPAQEEIPLDNPPEEPVGAPVPNHLGAIVRPPGDQPLPLVEHPDLEGGQLQSSSHATPPTASARGKVGQRYATAPGCVPSSTWRRR